MAKTEAVTIKVTPEEKEAIKAQAAKEDITVSKLLHKKIFKGDVKMSIDEMINELKHYTNADLMDRTINEICEMYHELFKGEA